VAEGREEVALAAIAAPCSDFRQPSERNLILHLISTLLKQARAAEKFCGGVLPDNLQAQLEC
jgi:hypothetical protein